jgi:protein ImuB
MVRQRSVEQVSLFLIHDSLRRQRHPDTVLPHRWLEPECDPSRWERGLMERVARESLPAPVRTLRLRLDAHQPAPAETAGLAGVAAAPARRAEAFRSQRARLIEDLTARLGADRVRHLKLHPDHRPERASALVDPTSSDRHPQARRASPPSTASSAPAGALLRPAWLLPQPQALEERAGHLWWGHQRLEVVGRPERIESGWFDGDLQCRDYHWARTPDHRWAWVYRQRRSAASPSVNLKASAPAPPDAWFLQGWFT